MSDTAIINNNSYISHICNRVQKITEALYRVTDIFPDEEPLKWVLRKEGLDIFNVFIKISSASLHERAKFIDISSSRISQILYLLELASLGTFISKMNFEVIRREYDALCRFVKDNENDLLPEYSINLESVRNPEIPSQNTPVDKSVKRPLRRGGGEARSEASEARRSRILELVRQKEWIRVGDIKGLFEGLSEKTIQRDLICMVNNGTLRRDGDKRWTKYGLK